MDFFCVQPSHITHEKMMLVVFAVLLLLCNSVIRYRFIYFFLNIKMLSLQGQALTSLVVNVLLEKRWRVKEKE